MRNDWLIQQQAGMAGGGLDRPRVNARTGVDRLFHLPRFSRELGLP